MPTATAVPFRRRASFILAGCIATLLAAPATHGADSAWSNVLSDSAWATAGNWNNGVPGLVGGTANTDTATFSAAPTATARVVSLDANRNVKFITFGSTTTLGYTISGSSSIPLRLSSDGVIKNLDVTGAHADLITAPVFIQGDGGNATFTANATSAGTLTVGNSSATPVSGVSTAGKVTTLTLNGTNTAANAVGILSDGTAGGRLALIKSDAGIWTIGLASNASTFTGGITINGGILRAATTTSGQAFGAANAITLSGVVGTALDLNVTTGSQTIGSLTGGGSSGGNVTLGSSTLTLGLDHTSTSYAGAISGTGGIIKLGNGTQTFANANSYTGITRVNGGTLALDFSASTAPASNIIATTSALNLAGGTLSITGKASSTNSQTVAGTTLVAGNASAINLSAGTLNPLLLTLGAITRTAVANVGATLDITLSTGVQSATNGVRTTTTNTRNSVLTNTTDVAYATIAGTDWAGLNSGNIVPLLAGGGSYSTGIANYTTSNNVDVSDGDAPAASRTVNTLRLNGNYTLTLSGTDNIVSTGGILVTNAATTEAKITGGTLRSSGTADALQLINYGTQLTVESTIGDNGTDPTVVTLAGPGTTFLKAANIYTGATYITGGTVKMGNATALGAGIVTFGDKASAVLDVNGLDVTLASIAGGGTQGLAGQITIGTTGGTVAVGAQTLTLGTSGTATSTFGGSITGTTGSIVKVGTNLQQLLGANSLTGGVTIKSGTLSASGITGNNALGSGTVTLGDSAGGTAAATLRVGNITAVVGNTIYNNAIVLAPNTTGVLDINSSTGTGSMDLRGGVTGPNNFSINSSASGGGTLTFSTNPINNTGTLTIGGSITNTNISISGGIGSNVTNVALVRNNTFSSSNNGITISNTVNNTGTISNLGTAAQSNTISAAIGLNVTGIIQNSASATLTLTGTSTFRTPITVSTGTLILTGNQAAGINSPITLANVAGATLNLSGGTGVTAVANIGSLAGGGTTGGNVVLTAANNPLLTIGSNHLSTTYAGVISGGSGTSALRKIGTGTLTLTGASTYAGTTTAVNGNLVLDYASADPQGSNAISLSGGQITFKGNASTPTTDTVGTITTSAYTRNTLAVQNNAVISTGVWTSAGSTNPLLVDVSTGGTLRTSAAFATTDSASAVAVKLNDIVMLGTTSAGSKRADVYVKDATGVGFATQNGSNALVRYTDATTLFSTDQASDTVVTTNYQLATSLTRTAALNFQTLAIDTSGGAVTLNMGTNALSATGSGRGILVTGSADALITSSGGTITNSNHLTIANYGTGTTTLGMNLISNALVKAGPGLVVYTGNVMAEDTHVAEGTLRFASATDYSTNVVRIYGGGVFELGADLNGAVAGDFTKASGNTGNSVALLGDGGFSAFGANRTVNLGGATATLTWGGSTFFLSDSNAADNDYIFKLGSTTSTSTLDFVNPIALGVRQRFVEVADGISTTNVDGRLSGILSGTGGLTKTGAGTLEVSATNNFTGPTVVTAGTLQISGSINTSPSVSVTSGTLLLSGAGNKIGDTTPLTLNNGTLKFADGGAGVTESLGALILASTSTLDFGSGTSLGNTFNFSNLSAATITALNSGTISLNIWNWSGNDYDPAASVDTGADTSQDRLLFGSLAGLNSSGLGKINFYSGAGTGPLGTGSAISFGSNFEIVPVPEPSSTALLGALGLFGLIGFRERRRLQRNRATR